MNKIILGIIFFFSLSVVVIANSSEVVKVKLNKNSNVNRYIVVLKDDDSNRYFNSASSQSKRSRASLMAGDYGLSVKKVYQKVINGFVVEGELQDIKELSKRTDVEYIEQDVRVSVNALTTQNNVTWGLDRIDQRSRNLNGTYRYDRTGSGVNAYVIDTGIRTTHTEFGGRAAVGWDVINNRVGANTDCNGHGTHVAGTIGGSTYGVAKSVDLISVRVLPCNGEGWASDVASGFDWVTVNGQLPGVINASVGGGASSALDSAVRRAVSAGFVVVVAAGNHDKDACSDSPSRVKEALTVGATDINDKRADFSNYGQCVDVWAPGKSVLSASSVSNTASTTKSGTSMASPHVAGIAALYLQGAPNASVNNVINFVMSKVTANKVADRGTIDTPNLFAYSLATNNKYSVMHRYYNHSIGDHFYTVNFSELQSAPDSRWAYEGSLGYVQRKNADGSSPLYRYNHSGSTDHFYTVNFGELGNGGSGWTYEGVAAYLPPASNATKSVYRYYNKKIGDHLYNTNWDALGAGNSSWKYEGVAGQVFTQPQD